MSKKKVKRPKPRNPKGFRDIFAGDVRARWQMMETIRSVYERYGFEPLETPAMEYVDVLGKFLPESDTPEGGIFAMKDDDDNWIALRYDLTAPLSRVVSQYGQDLPKPFRRYQFGPVYRLEKPGPGRFREFYQFDIDTVGSPKMAADAEVCAILCESLETLGIKRGDYVVRVNNRKILNGVLEAAGILSGDDAEKAQKQLVVLRAVDKLDRLGLDGVRNLLGKGRMDESGDYTHGAELSDEQIEKIMDFVSAGSESRVEVCDKLEALIGESEQGHKGVEELREINTLLDALSIGPDQVQFDPSVVRGLAYYTGPVYEAVLTFEVPNEKGQIVQFGSVAGGGRYDHLVQRFTGNIFPATGASIGVDRLLSALKALGKLDQGNDMGPVVVTVVDKNYVAQCQQMVQELRQAGITAELYLGKGGFGPQLKYADKRRSPVAVIAGGDEFEKGEVSLKDLRLGAILSKEIEDRDEWRKGQPAQITIPRDQLVEKTKEMLARTYESDGEE